MQNGYCLPTSPQSLVKLSKLLRASPDLHEPVRHSIRVGMHRDTEVNPSAVSGYECKHRVCQVFCSALPVSYAEKTHVKDWEPFAKLVLESMYESTLAVGAWLAAEREARVKVFLTFVGGGVFGNDSSWIAQALERALDIYAKAPLDVKLVHFEALPKKGFFADLKTGWWMPNTANSVATVVDHGQNNVDNIHDDQPEHTSEMPRELQPTKKDELFVEHRTKKKGKATK